MKTKILVWCLLASSSAIAAESMPNLPPTEVVERVLRSNPTVQAYSGQVRVEEANRTRLEAGSYEWNMRIGNQQRRSMPPGTTETRFNEWNAAIERPVRMPGKASLDAELGAAGVALAETAQGDAMHETSRSLLRAWFLWLKESAAATQWTEQITLLEKQTSAVKRRQQLGDAAQLESIQAEAALAQAKAQLAQIQVRQVTAAEDLRQRFPGLPIVAPTTIAEPQPISGSASEWIAAILEHSHELELAHGEVIRSQVLASRIGRDKLPDPTFGLNVSRERNGEDRILGAYISIPLPGEARSASSDAAIAQADVAGRREAVALQKISAEAAALYYSANAALSTWQASRSAAEGMTRAADMSARAYQLGEGTLNDLLNARRFANDAQLVAKLSQLDALELRYRLLLDSHRLWVFDGEKHPGD